MRSSRPGVPRFALPLRMRHDRENTLERAQKFLSVLVRSAISTLHPCYDWPRAGPVFPPGPRPTEGTPTRGRPRTRLHGQTVGGSSRLATRGLPVPTLFYTMPEADVR
jgi:hypothetical protein